MEISVGPRRQAGSREADAEIACDRGCDAHLPAGILGLEVTPANAACKFVLEPEEDEPAAGVDSAILGVLKRFLASGISTHATSYIVTSSQITFESVVNQVNAIDFGLAKKFRDPKTHLHIPYRENKNFTGTARYTSTIWALSNLVRHDDLESLAYVLIYYEEAEYDHIMKRKMTTKLFGNDEHTAALQHPFRNMDFSHGLLYINTNNTVNPIVIDPQYYSHLADVVMMHEGIKFARNVNVTFGTTLGAEITPGD
ncbi:hypothetical protein K443DRAFT_10381 [Laccaria amethystina LaAM-08-1]|uniref:Uncharacterized protein n=1 Tax=Laccaria amethystina LaAM-08-1 TaxID=1095629 RepID=A0A0C9WL02_9AGAR|nr:hypothetical protein K443DRAFT_10381 [Laccaria amethystina LaAM-08-1]